MLNVAGTVTAVPPVGVITTFAVYVPVDRLPGFAESCTAAGVVPELTLAVNQFPPETELIWMEKSSGSPELVRLSGRLRVELPP